MNHDDYGPGTHQRYVEWFPMSRRSPFGEAEAVITWRKEDGYGIAWFDHDRFFKQGGGVVPTDAMWTFAPRMPRSFDAREE